MRAVLGIGNPGLKYDETRHNIGFKILDKFADKYKLLFEPSKEDYYIVGSVFNASPFFLIKPTTYVNGSGIAALQIKEKYNLQIEDILVVTDDLNIETGKLKIKKSGSDGGHNGISSLIYELNSDLFPRLRFGIGNNFNKGEMANFVLSKFSENELELVNPAIEISTNIIKSFIEGGIKSSLDYFSTINQQTN